MQYPYFKNVFNIGVPLAIKRFPTLTRFLPSVKYLKAFFQPPLNFNISGCSPSPPGDFLVVKSKLE